MENEINRLYAKFWETKGARFNAAKRIELHDKWSTITISIISVYIISLNLTVLFPDRPAILSNSIITFSTICLSIFVLVISLIISSRNYKSRAEKFHSCGREINKVYDKICIWKNTSEKPSINELSELNNAYYNILDKYENHKRIDYLMFMNEHPDDFKKMIKNPVCFSLKVKSMYYLDTVLRYWIFILIPLIIYLIY